VVLDSAFFGAISDITKLVPKFSERRKKEIQEETLKLKSLEYLFHRKAVEFSRESFSNEILGIAYELKKQSEYLKELYVIYAKEIKANEGNKT